MMMMMTTWCATAIQGRSFPVTASFWTESVSFTVYIIWDMYIIYLKSFYACFQSAFPQFPPAWTVFGFSVHEFIQSLSRIIQHLSISKRFPKSFSHQAARKLFWGHAIRSTTWASLIPVVAACLRCLPNLLVWLMKCWVTWIKTLLLDHERPWSETCFFSGHWLNENWICSNMIISFHGSNRTFTQHLTLTCWASDDEARSIGIHQCTGTLMWSKRQCRFLSEKTSSRLYLNKTMTLNLI